MIYEQNLDCVSEKAKILVKQKEDKYFKYLNIGKLAYLLEEKKEMFTLNANYKIDKIIKIESIGLQEFMEIKTFSGSKVLIGQEAEVYIDDEWILSNQLRFHEDVFVYDIFKNDFKETFIMDIQQNKKSKAYQVFTEQNNGFVVNNLLVRNNSK
ncbi:MAG: hypothetical protein PHY08_00220 [Candidatus Cloacimonetes bacterium]|nr:hypothetical protein [Candidatus Cloacimonadota bacterium]